MFKLDDLTGRRFGRLTVVKRAENYVTRDGINRQTQWECECDCGTKGVIVLAQNLKTGKTVSCGCYRKEKSRETAYKIKRKKDGRYA